MLAYILYELSILSLALAAQRLVTDEDKGLAEQICGALAIKLLLTSLIPLAAGAVRMNSPIYYWSVTVIAGVLSLGQFLAAPPLRLQPWSKTTAKEAIAVMVLGLVCVSVALGRAGPFSETDSLVNFSYVVEWAHNRHTPYFMSYDYSSLWEMNFVPAVVLRASDAVIWWPAAQAIFLLATALYLLGRVLLGERYLAWLVVAATLTLPAFLNVSGYGTLKNDMIYNAGVLLLILGLVSRNSSSWRQSAVLVATGLAFLSVKYSGPVYGALVIMGWLLLERRRNPSRVRQDLVLILVAGVAALLVGGHFYVKNMLLFHNPLYPYPMKVGPLSLPGEGALPSTSLLRRAGDLTLWTDFVKSELYGLAGPICAVFGILAAISLAVPRRTTSEAETLTAWATLIGVLIYFSSIFSDWLGPTLVSVRYATGAIGLTFLLLARVASRLGPNARDIAAGLLTWCAATQALAILNWSFRYDPTPVRLMFAGAALAVVVVGLAATLFTAAQYRAIVLLAAATACLTMGVRLSGLNHVRYWLPEWSPITKHVAAESHPERVFLIEGSSDLSPLPFLIPAQYANLAPALYPAIGAKFQNTVDFGTIDDLSKRVMNKASYDDIDLIGWNKLDPSMIDTVTKQIAAFGYQIQDRGDFVVRYSKTAH